MSRYGETALGHECAELARLADGRHAQLCHASFALGQLVGAREIGRSEAESALYAAALACGYVKKRGKSATESTIRTGLDKGATTPRVVKHAAQSAPARQTAPMPAPDVEEADRKRKRAQRLWEQRQPIGGTIAETYLRRVRGYGGLIPPTLAYLPSRGGHERALIAAFGIATEPEPGLLAIAADDVCAVQIIHLTVDGRKEDNAPDRPNKITVGRALGSPIIVAPPNDLLGMCVTEGIEDALSVHKATGLGAWASGGFGFMPALADAVPSYMDCVTVIGDDNDNGRRYATELGVRLKARGITAIVKILRAGSAYED
jgi:Toprim domain